MFRNLYFFCFSFYFFFFFYFFVQFLKILLKKKKKLPFIFHWSDAGVASWFDIAVAVGELAKELGINKKEANVLPINTSEYPTPAQRPKYSLLNTQNTSNINRKV